MLESTSKQLQLKVCTKCGEAKPATAEYFHRAKRGRYGLRADCKECFNAYSCQQYAANPAPHIEKTRQWGINNPDRKHDYNAQYYRANAERLRINKRQWDADNPNYQREYRAANSEHVRRHRHEYKLANRVNNRTYTQRRRARVRELPHDLTLSEWHTTLDYFDNACAYCGKTQDESEGILHQEHVIPVSQGGGYTKDNIVPACGGIDGCNHKKGARTPEQAGMTLRKPFPLLTSEAK